MNDGIRRIREMAEQADRAAAKARGERERAITLTNRLAHAILEAAGWVRRTLHRLEGEHYQTERVKRFVRKMPLGGY